MSNLKQSLEISDEHFDSNSSPSTGASPLPDSGLRHTSILLVDRDLTTLTTITKRLSARGFKVVATQTATEALQRLVWQYFDLVITSDRLEGVSGHQLTEHLKSLPTIPRGAGVPVLILNERTPSSDGTSPLPEIADAYCALNQLDEIERTIDILLRD